MKPLLTTLTFICTIHLAFSQQNTVKVSPTTQKFLGTISKLDRSKFFNIHDGGRNEDVLKFLIDYNASLGRGFWGPFSESKQKTKEVGKYPDPKDPKDEKNKIRQVTQNIDTEHPKVAFKDGIDVKKAGKWAADYYKNYPEDPIPEYFEPINEPFVHAKDFYEGEWNSDEINRIKKQMADFYAACGKEIHSAPELVNMKVIGYSSAWPSLELNDFSHWNTGMKMFMDVAGKHMDGIATHLYDGINVEGQDNIRSGSNSEAILDLIETYSFVKWNKVKPHAISEYGAIEKGYPDGYSDVRSIQSIRSINHILLSLLDREDRMLISVPFITGKATWHINEANNYEPYQAVLFRPKTIEKTDDPNKPILKDWIYTSRIYFYELWKDVKGNRVQIHSSNPDIQRHAFVDKNKLYLILSNLDDQELTANIDIDMITVGEDLKVTKVSKKSLKIYAKEDPIFENTVLDSTPKELNLLPHETSVFTFEFEKPISFTKKALTSNTYSTTHLQPIVKDQEIIFDFKKVPTGIYGKAVLKMGIGRKHNKSKAPIIIVNGVVLKAPENWKGYDQKNREDFFGVIDIPFPLAYLRSETTISVKFPDDSGRISSMILETEVEE